MALLQTALYVAVGFAAGFFYKQYQADKKNPLDRSSLPLKTTPAPQKKVEEKETSGADEAPEAAVQTELTEDQEKEPSPPEDVPQSAVQEESDAEDVIDVDEASDSVVWDDLTKVKGIGPVFAERFYEAGVKNFAELAALTPERAREIADLQDWHQADPADWIAQAAELS